MLGGLQAYGVASSLLGEEAELVESEAAVYGGLAHPDVMLLGAGEVGQSERKRLRGDYPNLGVYGGVAAALLQRLSQLHVDAASARRAPQHVGLKYQAHFRLAVTLHLCDSWEGEYGLDDRIVVTGLRPDHYVQVANGLPAPASASSELGPDYSLYPGDPVFKGLAIEQADVHPTASLVSAQQIDSFEILLLALLSEPR